MPEPTSTKPATDQRFHAVLCAVADAAVNRTGTSLNAEAWLAYRPLPADAPWDAVPEEYTAEEWMREVVVDPFLEEPTDEVRAMLAARSRLGQNVRLIEGTDLDRVRARLREQDALSDTVDELLDFVAEIRKIAKEI